MNRINFFLVSLLALFFSIGCNTSEDRTFNKRSEFELVIVVDSTFAEESPDGGLPQDIRDILTPMDIECGIHNINMPWKAKATMLRADLNDSQEIDISPPGLGVEPKQDSEKYMHEIVNAKLNDVCHKIFNKKILGNGKYSQDNINKIIQANKNALKISWDTKINYRATGDSVIYIKNDIKKLRELISDCLCAKNTNTRVVIFYKIGTPTDPEVQLDTTIKEKKLDSEKIEQSVVPTIKPSAPKKEGKKIGSHAKDTASTRLLTEQLLNPKPQPLEKTIPILSHLKSSRIDFDDITGGLMVEGIQGCLTSEYTVEISSPNDPGTSWKCRMDGNRFGESAKDKKALESITEEGISALYFIIKVTCDDGSTIISNKSGPYSLVCIEGGCQLFRSKKNKMNEKQ